MASTNQLLQKAFNNLASNEKPAPYTGKPVALDLIVLPKFGSLSPREMDLLGNSIKRIITDKFSEDNFSYAGGGGLASAAGIKNAEGQSAGVLLFSTRWPQEVVNEIFDTFGKQMDITFAGVTADGQFLVPQRKDWLPTDIKITGEEAKALVDNAKKTNTVKPPSNGYKLPAWQGH